MADLDGVALGELRTLHSEADGGGLGAGSFKRAIKAKLVNPVALLFLWPLELFLRILRKMLFHFWHTTKKAHLWIKSAQGHFWSAQHLLDSSTSVVQQVFVEPHDQAIDHTTQGTCQVANDGLNEAETETTPSRCDTCLSEFPPASLLHCPLRHTICSDCLPHLDAERLDGGNAAPYCPECGDALVGPELGAAPADPLYQLADGEVGVIEGGFEGLDDTLEPLAELGGDNSSHYDGEEGIASDDEGSLVLDLSVHAEEEEQQFHDADDDKGRLHDTDEEEQQFDGADQEGQFNDADNEELQFSDADDENDAEGVYLDNTTLRIRNAMRQCVREIEDGKKYTWESESNASLSGSDGGFGTDIDTDTDTDDYQFQQSLVVSGASTAPTSIGAPVMDVAAELKPDALASTESPLVKGEEGAVEVPAEVDDPKGLLDEARKIRSKSQRRFRRAQKSHSEKGTRATLEKLENETKEREEARAMVVQAEIAVEEWKKDMESRA